MDARDAAEASTKILAESAYIPFMQTFFEYIRARQPALPDPVTMMHRAGIDPGGPSEAEVLRMTKRWKKAAERGPKRAAGLGVVDQRAEALLSREPGPGDSPSAEAGQADANAQAPAAPRPLV